MSRKIYVCSKDLSHDLSAAAPGARSCPVCGAPLVERIVDSDTHDDVIAGDLAPKGPPPAFVCSLVPAHDVSTRASGDTTCPHPGCGGALIELECPADPLTHDVSAWAPGSTTCPVCARGLVQPVCSSVPSHSMVSRAAGKTVCPICGKPLIMQPYHLPEPARTVVAVRKEEVVQASKPFPFLPVGIGVIFVVVIGAVAGSMMGGHKTSARQPEIGTDRPGLDSRSFDTLGEWQACQAQCDTEAACKAWTWVKAGVQGPKARCWLKSGVPSPVHNANTVSGVK